MKKEKKKEEREDKKRFIPRKILLFIPILPPLLTLLTSPKARATEFNSQVTNFLNEGIENGLKSEWRSLKSAMGWKQRLDGRIRSRGRKGRGRDRNWKNRDRMEKEEDPFKDQWSRNESDYLNTKPKVYALPIWNRLDWRWGSAVGAAPRPNSLMKECKFGLLTLEVEAWTILKNSCKTTLTVWGCTEERFSFEPIWKLGSAGRSRTCPCGIEWRRMKVLTLPMKVCSIDRIDDLTCSLSQMSLSFEG